MPVRICIMLAAVLLVQFQPLRGDDWPQILGPSRNAHAPNETLPAAWPPGGPKVLWRYPLGAGYAGAAVLGKRVVAFHRVEGKERVECLSLEQGKSLWKSDFAANYRGGIDPDIGPRCVPVLTTEAAFVFGAAGDLHCVELATGKQRWSRELYADYGGDEGYFGAGSTPVLVGGKLLINVGGRKAGIVAIDAASGKTLWQATDEAASYSSPTVVTLSGRQQAIFITRMNCVLVDPDNGQVTNLFPFGKRGPTVNAATPLAFDDKLFVTASYGVGAVLAKLSGKSSTAVWTSDDTLSSQYATPVQQGGYLYGIHGREDVGVAELRCVEAATGRVCWQRPDFGVAHTVLAGNKLLLQKSDGHLVLAAANPAEYEELSATQLTTEPTRALPALAAGRLFVRTGSGGGNLICLDIAGR